MTQAEWLDCADPTPMLEFLKGKASDRKLRLFSVACCRRVWALLPDERSRNAVAVAEQFADWSTSLSELKKARAGAKDVARSEYHPGDPLAVVHGPVFAADVPTYHYDGFRNAAANAAAASPGRSMRTERSAQAELLRELFGPIPLQSWEREPAWLTWSVLVIAQGIYDDRAFDRLSILATRFKMPGATTKRS